MGRTLTLSAEFPAGFEDAVTQTDELPVSSEVHPAAVSYTHLDVYKGQSIFSALQDSASARV